MKVITAILMVGLVFLFCFFTTTALLDFVCRYNGYYDEAAKETTVLYE